MAEGPTLGQSESGNRMKNLSIALLILSMTVACGDGAQRDEDGQVVAGGNVNVLSLAVGDCFQDSADDNLGEVVELNTAKAVPCSEPHDNEVFDSIVVMNRDEWPGDDFFIELGRRDCLETFEMFVGRDYATSRLDFGLIWPTEDSWNRLDDREIDCFLYDLNLLPLVGSMRGSAE